MLYVIGHEMPAGRFQIGSLLLSVVDEMKKFMGCSHWKPVNCLRFVKFPLGRIQQKKWKSQSRSQLQLLNVGL